jgi:hypothetical protein
MQPSRKHNALGQTAGFPCKNHKYRLRNFLRLMRVARVTQRNRIHPVDMAPDQRGERLFGIVFHKFLQQNDVGQLLHLYI